jgi:hypothetical protein
MKESLYAAGLERMRQWCALNQFHEPTVNRLARTDRLYHLATCAFYRPTTISIMVEKCAHPGTAGRAWSWPAYVIDRTPYGVIQHELGHHVDLRSSSGSLFSQGVWEFSREDPLTGYLGTDQRRNTFYMEWFAEIFRLFVTNPDLCRLLRPRFYEAVTQRHGLKPIASPSWDQVLAGHLAPSRITDQARKKITNERPDVSLFEGETTNRP